MARAKPHSVLTTHEHPLKRCQVKKAKKKIKNQGGGGGSSSASSKSARAYLPLEMEEYCSGFQRYLDFVCGRYVGR